MNKDQATYSLEEFIESIIPIILLVRKERERNPKRYKKTQLWYLYRQIYYGFGKNGVLDWNKICFASVKAQNEYLKLNKGDDIRKRVWEEQSEFDGQLRHEGKFLLEHVFTGDMFRKAVDNLKDEELTISNIKEIIEDNYYVAWILREENRKLGKKSRGTCVNDAFKFYKNKEIYFIE